MGIDAFAGLVIESYNYHRIIQDNLGFDVEDDSTLEDRLCSFIEQWLAEDQGYLPFDSLEEAKQFILKSPRPDVLAIIVPSVWHNWPAAGIKAFAQGFSREIKGQVVCWYWDENDQFMVRVYQKGERRVEEKDIEETQYVWFSRQLKEDLINTVAARLRKALLE